MNIELTNRYVYQVAITSDDVQIVEDVEHREYKQKDVNGKTIYTSPTRDIKTESLEMFSTILEEMLYHRSASFNGSSLIKALFDKLPSDVASNLAKELNDDYHNFVE